jgi:outer membrane protein TolC
MRSVGDHFSQMLRAVLALVILSSGCRGRKEFTYLGEAEFSDYRAHATEIDYPNVDFPTDDAVATTQPPRTLLDVDEMPIREITLSEAIETGLKNAEIIRGNGQFLSPGNGLYSAGERVPSALDPAIQESGVLFGGRGVEAALADFDARFTTSLLWRRNDQYANSAIAAPGLPATVAESANGDFLAGISKRFAQGGSISVLHDVFYDYSNLGNPLFPSAFSGDVIASFRQPLLAGAGVDFTRIAGPINPNFGGITGVSQGVVIARINNDISLADFQADVRNLAKDIEDTYWDLYLAYRQYDVAVTAYNSAAATWRQADIEFEAGAGTRAAAAQARDQLFLTRAQADNARSSIYSTETRFRRLIGLPVNDGAVLRPADEPITAQLVPDWESSLTRALTHRIELRRQKFLCKSLELQLRAARNLTRPQLDILADYRVNGFGNQLIGVGENDPDGTQQGLNNFYSTLTRGDTTGYSLGFEMNVPIGFRSALAQVRNYELRLSKAHKVLHVQEQEIAHELANAFQEVARTYSEARSNLNRYLAAEENVRFLEPRRLERDLLIDEFLRAQSRRADAESAYYTSLVNYNKAITNLLFREERLLEHDNITLAEGPWTADAYADAEEKAWARSYAFENEHLETRPAPFISPVPVDGPEFSRPIDAAAWPPTNEMPDQEMPLELPPEVDEAPAPAEAPLAPDALETEP